jgi:heme oxygenase
LYNIQRWFDLDLLRRVVDNICSRTHGLHYVNLIVNSYDKMDNKKQLNARNMKDTEAYQQYLREIEQEHLRLRRDIPFFSRKSWEDYVYRTPCAKQSKFLNDLDTFKVIKLIHLCYEHIIGFITAIGCSSIMVAHQLRLHSKYFKFKFFILIYHILN